MSEGLIYEPRSFWSIANVVSQAAVPTRVRLDKRHFFNGEQRPIEIRRIALAAVNYVLTGDPFGALDNETASVISRVRMMVSVPQRYHLNTRRFINCASMAPVSTAQPPAPGGAGEAFHPASMWGQCTLDFDKPLALPRNGTIEWDLSAHSPMNGVGVAPVDESAAVSAFMLYQERGGLFCGSARTREVPLLPYTGGFQPDPIEKWPYPPDGYGAGVPVGIPSSANWWPPQSRFPAAGRNSFQSFESTRDGSTEILGLRTFVDQLQYDANFAGQYGLGPFSTSMSMRTGCRIRTVNGGSQTWWWRPGAPLALVLDSITPALVFKLAEPVTLGPGEQLDVEMEFPAVNVQPQPSFHMGISFNGFAAIEG